MSLAAVECVTIALLVELHGAQVTRVCIAPRLALRCTGVLVSAMKLAPKQAPAGAAGARPVRHQALIACLDLGILVVLGLGYRGIAVGDVSLGGRLALLVGGHGAASVQVVLVRELDHRDVRQEAGSLVRHRLLSPQAPLVLQLRVDAHVMEGRVPGGHARCLVKALV